MNPTTSCSLLFLCLVQILWAYDIPRPDITFYRRGLKLSLSHEDGIERVRIGLFYFQHQTLAIGGPCSRADGASDWTFENFDVENKVGYNILSVIHVQRSGQNYLKTYTFSTREIHENATTEAPEVQGATGTSQ